MTISIQSDQDVALEVGARIHDLMWRRKINQTQLGEVLGVNQSTAGKKLRGEVGISVVELVKIAAYLEVEPASLLPRLDSNQRPFGYEFPQVSPVARCNVTGLAGGVEWVLAA